jgi:thiol-disulfide isomerase/thioredoxin
LRPAILLVILAALLASFALVPKVVQLVSFEQLQARTLKANDTLYVVNYWATWCRPCVAELPYFQEAARKTGGKKVKVLFVSLNSVKEKNKVQGFIENKNMEPQVYILNAGNPNVWIDKVDPSWGGSIPATVMYRNKEKVFFREGEFTQTELDSIINLKLK